MSSFPPKSHIARRKTVSKDAIRSLSVIPGIGPALAADLYLLGIHTVESLGGRDPETLYRKLSKLIGQPVDRCVLYTFRCAVYFASEAEPEPGKLQWWRWMD
jgi:nucleotidyltransferase/DNA polymerase involved in DNA repair